MKKILIFMFITGCITTPMMAQTETKTELYELKHSIGVAAGFTTGYGISYRYMGWKKGGVQFTFAPYYEEDFVRHSAGITLIYSLSKNDLAHLFLYNGNHYYYNFERFTSYDYPPIYTGSNVYKEPTPVVNTTEKSYFNTGLGVGVEFINSKKLSVNFMTGYAFYQNFKFLTLTAETAIYYKF